MPCSIYIIRNKFNSKVYIGQTWRSFDKRWKSGYGKCPALNNAIKLYGKDSFHYESLFICETQEAANYWEQYFIGKYNSTNKEFGYNIALGGSNSLKSEETKRKMSIAHKGQIPVNKGTGKPKISVVKNKEVSYDTRMKISNSIRTKSILDKYLFFLEEGFFPDEK